MDGTSPHSLIARRLHHEWYPCLDLNLYIPVQRTNMSDHRPPSALLETSGTLDWRLFTLCLFSHLKLINSSNVAQMTGALGVILVFCFLFFNPVHKCFHARVHWCYILQSKANTSAVRSVMPYSSTGGWHRQSPTHVVMFCRLISDGELMFRNAGTNNY